MKDQMLKIAGVKSEKEFYKKYPTEEAFMKKHGKALKKAAMGAKMVNDQLIQLSDFSNPPIAQDGTTAPAAGASNPATGYMQAGVDVLQGLSMIKEQKQAVKEAKQTSLLTGVQAQAAGSKPQQPLKNYYTRPEDVIVEPGQLNPAYGTGSNILTAEYGAMVEGTPTEIQNTYDPNAIYTDLGYEPLNDSDKQKAFYSGGKLTKAQNGLFSPINQENFGNFMGEEGGAKMLDNASNMFINRGRGPSAGSKIGGGIGQAAGTFFGGPIGGAIGKVAGQALGSLVDSSGRKIEKYDNQSNANIASVLGNYIPGQFANVMEDGGYVSNNWQPQLITKFGEHSVNELLKPDPTMDTLRSGGSLKQDYVAPSNRALQTYAMGGELQVYRGEAEPISTNPYLPDGGETVMFRGPSHEDGGMPISYGSSPVEVEGGEPAMKLRDGGTGEDNLVVFGNLKIDKQNAELLGDPKLKGKKFKNYAFDLSKIEAKQNKIIDKSTDMLDNLNVTTPFDRLTMGALQANLMGTNMKLKDIAVKKQDAAALQSAINDTAEEYGLVADDLAQGKIKEAKKGASIKAQNGYTSKYNLTPWEGNKDKLGTKTKSAYTAQQLDKIAENLGFKGTGNKAFQEFLLSDPNRAKSIKAKSKQLYGTEDVKLDEKLGAAFDVPEVRNALNKLDYKSLPDRPSPLSSPNFAKWNEEQQLENLPQVPEFTRKGKNSIFSDITRSVNQIIPYLRPSDAERLDPRQLIGEMYALSQNQLEPVQAQKYQPQLLSPYDISLQDQLNEVTAQTRAAERMAMGNPAALSAIAAQANEARNKILGEQMRINQGQRAQTYASNIQALNQAQLQNLQMFDTQQQRQEAAKSATKATTQAALNSIAAKYAQNKLENRQLGIMENLYNYRYDKSGRAINMNPLVDFDEMIANASPDELQKLRDMLDKSSEKSKTDTKKTSTKESRNGSIVKAIKNL